ncbi:MAG: hypothetical protein P8Y95_15105, partial [Gammaproteobacteria bacterium]
MKGVFWVFVLFISSFALETNAVANELPAVDSGWNYQDASASEANFRALIAQARDAEQQAYVAEAMTQLARSIGLQRRFDEAHAVLDEVETLLADDMSR